MEAKAEDRSGTIAKQTKEESPAFFSCAVPHRHPAGCPRTELCQGPWKQEAPLSPGANAPLLPSRLFFHLQQLRACSFAPSFSSNAKLDIGRPVRTAK